MKNAKLRNQKGFTIVELVIVIAVIAILAAVLIPTFSGVVERAKESSAKQAVTNAFKALYNNTMAEPNVDFPDGLVFTYDGYAYTFFDREIVALEKVKTETTLVVDGDFDDNVTKVSLDSIKTNEFSLIRTLLGSYSSSSGTAMQDAFYIMPNGTYEVYSATIDDVEYYFFTTDNLSFSDNSDAKLKSYTNTFCKASGFELEKDGIGNVFQKQLLQVAQYFGETEETITLDYSNCFAITASEAKRVDYQYSDGSDETTPNIYSGNSIKASTFAEYIKSNNIQPVWTDDGPETYYIDFYTTEENQEIE